MVLGSPKSYKSILLFFFTWIFYFQIQAQQRVVDSLNMVDAKYKLEDTIKVNIWDKLGFAHRNSGPDSVWFYSEKVFHLANKLRYKSGVAASYKLKSMAFFMQGQVPLAMESAQKSYEIYVELGDKKGQASMLNNLGMCSYEKGEQRKAIEYYLRSLEIRERLDIEVEIADSYNNLGNTYNSLGDYAQSLSYHFKALAVRERLGRQEDMADSYTNISSVYYMMHSYEESLTYAKKSYAIYRKFNQADGILNSMLNFGSIYAELKQIDLALNYFKKALALNKQLKIDVNLGIVYYNIGHLFLMQNKLADAKAYLDSSIATSDKATYYNEGSALTLIDLGIIAISNKQYDEAEKLLKKANDISVVIDSKGRQSEAIVQLANLYQLKGEFKLSSKYYYQALALNDSVHLAEMNKGVYESKMDYLLENQRQKIALLEKDKSLQDANMKFTRLWLTSLCVVILLLGALLFFQRRNVLRMRNVQQVIMHQSNELRTQADSLAEVNRVKDKVFSVLSHDLRGPINSLTSVMTMLNTDMLTAEEFSSMRDKFSVQLRTVNLMLDNLLHWSRANLRGIIDTNKSIVQLSKTVQQVILLTSEVAKNKQIRIESKLGIDSTVYADADHLDIIFRNVISNALKYTPVGGSIQITDKIVDDNRLIFVSDTGVGMSEEKLSELFTDLPIISQYGTKGEKGTGIGLIITKEFVKINNGTINVNSKLNEGTTFILSFPLKQV